MRRMKGLKVQTREKFKKLVLALLYWLDDHTDIHEVKVLKTSVINLMGKGICFKSV